MKKKVINVTRSYLPKYSAYKKYLKKIWKSHYLTNNGPILKELEKQLKNELKVKNIDIVSNGTIALQLALNSLNILEGEIITTPFSFVATTNAIIWERCTPIFVDIEPNNFGLDIDKIEDKITKKTKAILIVYVFGYPSHVEEIQKIAKKHKLKLIIDGAHGFGAEYKGRSVFSYGDIVTCSFHATKIFHTIEGGACFVNCDEATEKKLNLIKKFGYEGQNYEYPGINAKISEFNASMGLAIIPNIKKIIAKRKKLSELYDTNLKGVVTFPQKNKDLKYNYAYYPIIFATEEELLKVFAELNKSQIYPRRYFYPSLNKLKYITYQSCPVSEDIAKRIACLPLDTYLTKNQVKNICKIICNTIKKERASNEH